MLLNKTAITLKILHHWCMDVLLQLQHDYILGNYPIGRDDAAQLSALQILAEIGFVRRPESCALVIFYVHLVINFLPIVFSFS